MKNTLRAFTCIAIAALGVGCHKSDDQSASKQLEDAKMETKADAQQMKDYEFAQKAEFVAQMQSQLDALNKDLDALSNKIDTSSDAVKADAKPKLQALREQAAVMNKQLVEAKNATQSTWANVKADSQKAYEGLKDSLQQARQWASDKIAP